MKQTHIFLKGIMNLSWLVAYPYYMYLITMEKILFLFWTEQMFLYYVKVVQIIQLLSDGIWMNQQTI